MTGHNLQHPTTHNSDQTMIYFVSQMEEAKTINQAVTKCVSSAWIVRYARFQGDNQVH